MKRQLLIVASFCLVIGLAVAPAQGQTYIQAKVPFNFTVANQTFPAGVYTMIAAPHQVKIRNAQGDIVAMSLANELSGGTAEENGRLVFHCYRERCFLWELWSTGLGNGRQLLTSRAEAALAKEETAQYFAVLGEKPRK